MPQESPQKKRKTDQGVKNYSEESSNDGASSSSGEEMDIETSNGHAASNDSSSRSNDQKMGKKRAANGSETAFDNTAILSQMYEYKSNVFRMETEELLAEVKLDYQKRMGPVEKALHKLKNIIDTLPAKEPAVLSDAEKDMIKTHKIMIPFPTPRPAKDIKYKFAYVKPSYVNVVGSFALKTMVKENSGNNVDFVVQMPSSLFQEKDYLNYRYFHKRAYYLAYLAAGIHEAKDFKVNISFGLLNGDVLRPILLITPISGSEYDFTKSKCTIRILPCVSQDVFPKRKLGLSKNCVRPSAQSETTTDAAFPPTPSYNSSLLADTTYLHYLKLLHASATHCAAFRDACILGRVWLKQRGLSSELEFGGIGNFEWSALMAYLMKTGGAIGSTVLAAGYSNYQLFKATLQFLATRDLMKNPLVINGGGENISGCDIPVIIDGTVGLNIFFKTNPWVYKMLRQEAATTLKALNNSAQDQFDAIFLRRVDEPRLRYDLLVNIPIPGEIITATSSPDSTDIRVSFARRLYKVLTYGLNDRGGDSYDTKCVTVGFFLNGDKCHRLMDHGPTAENKKEAASFRKFWGEKAELRRFKDGSIVESVFWGEIKDPKIPVIHQVISYVIKHHFSGEISHGTKFIGDEYAQLLSNHQSPGTQATTKLFQPLITGYERLVKDLRSIEDLPLIIRQITPISSMLRFSTIQVPLSGLDVGDLMNAPAEVALQFESSGRWPDDLIAIQRTKIAFLLHLGQLLEETSADGNITSRVGLENQEPSREIFNASFLDVIYHSGPTFRIRIHHEREPYLLEKRSKDKTLPPHTRDIASYALSVYNRTFIKSPLHTTSLAKLCHRHAFLSPTIRLVKKWFAAHLLSSHFSEELIELIVVRQFVSPFPWQSPSSVMTGFLRTLEFLAAWDWRVDPLIVDTSDGDATDAEAVTAGLDIGVLKPSDIESITGKFEVLRKSDPGLYRTVLFVATNYDHDGQTWTETGPSRVVAARMTTLARSAVGLATKDNADGNNVATLFTHSLSDYDFVIHLNPTYLTGIAGGKSKSSKYKNLSELEGLQVGFDPAGLFLQDLQKLYTSALVLFHGSQSSATTIGALWAPHTATPRSWKVNLTYSTIPTVGSASANGKDKAKKKSNYETNDDGEKEEEKDTYEEEGTVVINKSAILNDIARLGGGLVERIQLS